jgi:hypothetical protein
MSRLDWDRGDYLRDLDRDDRAMGLRLDACQSRHDHRDDVRDIPLAPWCPCPNCKAPVDEEERLLVIPGFVPAPGNLGCLRCIEEDAHLAEPAPADVEERVRRRHAVEYFQ